jgi:hypothetical protein
MEQNTQPDINRTGVQTSPFDIEQLVADIENEPSMAGYDTPPSPPRSSIRSTYYSEGGMLGSMPSPVSQNGTAESENESLSEQSLAVLIDKLGERLAFERSGVRLYEALLAKCEAQPQMISQDVIAELARFKDEELEHFLLLQSTLVELGADPTVATPCANLAGVQGIGLMQAVTDPRTTPLQALHAILNAELIDNCGWSGLIELSEQLQLTDLAQRFEAPLEEENEHMQSIQTWVNELVLVEALGADTTTTGTRH